MYFGLYQQTLEEALKPNLAKTDNNLFKSLFGIKGNLQLSR